MDLQYDKIFNEWILVCLAAGLSYCVRTAGIYGVLKGLAFMAIPFMLLYPLFMIGTLGAGDIKLLAVISCFFTLRQVFLCLAITFLTGAAFSLLKMFAEKNFLQRMGYLLSYMHEVSKGGKWKLYEEGREKQKDGNKARIHFALPVLLSVLLIKGGRF